MQFPQLSYFRKMKLFLSCFLMLFIFCNANAALKDEQQIKVVLQLQSEAWNKGDIDAYMKGYWNNDKLQFIGKNGPTYGYQQTLERYKRSYPDAETMGQLQFTLLEIKPLSASYYFVTGKWELHRKAGDISGYFTLLFKKFGSKWLIVSDHSS